MKSRVIIIFLFVSYIFILAGVSYKKYSDSTKVARHIETGLKHAGECKYEEAIAVFNGVVGDYPDNIKARVELAKAYKNLDRLDETERVLKEIIDITPVKYDTYIELSMLYESQYRIEEALSILEQGHKSTGSSIIRNTLDELNARMNKTRGNSSGNILNGGIFAAQGDWIYGNLESKLYKFNPGSGERIKLSDHNPYYINVVGGWIYYSNASDDGGIYKIRTDGTDSEKLCSCRAWFVNVQGGWVYFGNIIYMENGVILSRLYKMNTDGSNRTMLSYDNVDSINVSGDWIYYRNISEKDCTIYRIKVDGTDRTKLCSDYVWNIDMEEDWIYYSSAMEDGKLYKIKPDGTGKTRVYDCRADVINVTVDRIYFWDLSDYSDETFTCRYRLCSVKTDGTDMIELSDESLIIRYEPLPMPSTCVEGDWIYYEIRMNDQDQELNPEFCNELYKIRTDGTGKEPLN